MIAAAWCGAAISAEAPAPGLLSALAMHGQPALAPGFERFPYVSPEARRGGRLVLGVQGSFDGLNPFTIKGLTAAQGITPFVVEPLMRRSLDEPFTLYPLIARAVEMPDERTRITFHLDPRARFSDGHPVTSEDVRFSFVLLRDKGRPNFRAYYGKVAAVETPDPLTIRFDFPEAGDRELPLILGLMPVLPKHATDVAAFEESGYAPPVGSGPYRLAGLKRGQSVVYRRDPAWWGDDLAVNRGIFNVDEIRYEYYRDANALFEAFKAGLVDVRVETDPARWLSGYDIPAVRAGRILRESLPDRSAAGMTGFVFNTRRDTLRDPRLREALGYLFDFPWVNATLFGGLYTRDISFFGGELAAMGHPADAAERVLLAPFPDAVRPDILAGDWRPPELDGSGRDRRAPALAMKLLDRAGYVRAGRVVRPDSGEPLSVEIMVAGREQERLALIYAAGLARIGVRARVRIVDAVAYERRRQRFDFDIMIAAWPGTPSPGNEQAFRWSREAADREGSFNFAGVRSAAADAAIDALLAARDRADLTSAARALDRVLLSGFYVVPLFHAPRLWLAYRAGQRRPDELPLLGLAIELWWREQP